MATMPQVSSAESQIIDEAAMQMARLLEEHFDEKGWSEEERNRRLAAATAHVAAATLVS